MAFGATPGKIAVLIQKRAAAMVGAGLAAGLLAAAALTRLIRALLCEVSPGDPISLAAAIAALVITAALAAWIPARRATGVDPMAALREE